MASITIDCIDIDGITEKYLLLDLKLNIEPNDHGHTELLIRMGTAVHWRKITNG